jgi:hypothetical protein
MEGHHKRQAFSSAVDIKLTCNAAVVGHIGTGRDRYLPRTLGMIRRRSEILGVRCYNRV